MEIKTVMEKIKRMDKKRVYAALAGLALTVLAAGYALFGKNDSYASGPKEELQPIAATAVTIEPQMLDSVLSASGTLSSRNTSLLSSKVMGRVVELTVNEGDSVKKGRLLVKIDSGEIRAQAYQAQAAYSNAKLHYERIKRLYEEKAATQMEMEQATLGFESARAGLNAAKAMESYTAITAPISGRIVERRINLGEMALPGQPILKIEDNANLRLEVTLKEQDLRFVHPGQPATVRIDALPGREIMGRVAQVVPAADVRTHSFIAKIDIPADRSLITGMYGKAFFTVGKREAILVPHSAVVQRAGLTGVYIVSHEGNALFQMVQLGEEAGENVEAITGLKPGDRVVVDSQDNARIDGRKIVVAQN